jgi:hypothetical protein
MPADIVTVGTAMAAGMMVVGTAMAADMVAVHNWAGLPDILEEGPARSYSGRN